MAGSRRVQLQQHPLLVTDLARSWLTVAQAAAATGRSTRTIRRWITDQRLDHLELGGVRYVNEHEVLVLEREMRHAVHAPRAGRPGARPRVPLPVADIVTYSHHRVLPVRLRRDG